uniref:NF-kappa-B essential modulator NEMO CC2-LZ domain-containing protein n=1 Tax=Lepeophtheirus salmonis TaxID=72036 RepID=A0A0K2T0C8_LEPSM
MFGSLFNFQLKKENQDLKKIKKKDQDDSCETPGASFSSPEGSKKDKNKKDKKNSKNLHLEELELKNKEIQDLKQRFEASETRSKEDIAKLNTQKLNLERDLATLRADSETWSNEKWELTAANTDLQSRLQQMAMNMHIQGSPDQMLQEEIRNMKHSLNDERKVTEKLSRNLELEKRKVESLEQKAKASNNCNSSSSSGSRKSQKSSSTGIHLPDEMKVRDDKLAESMERYRIQCDNLGCSLRECEDKLLMSVEGPSVVTNELREEIGKLKKLLSEEKKRTSIDQHQINEMNGLFGSVLKEYQNALDYLRDLQNERKMKTQQQNVYEEIKESNHETRINELTALLLQSEEQLKGEQNKIQALKNKIKETEVDIEAVPILRAQVEVYQADFNAEREAREKIAGEKSDLEEELRKLKNSNRVNTAEALDEQRHIERFLATDARPGTAPALRNTINHLADNSFPR